MSPSEAADVIADILKGNVEIGSVDAIEPTVLGVELTDGTRVFLEVEEA